MINALRVMSFVALVAFLLAGCGREQSSDGGENPAATIVRVADQHDVGASDDHDHAAENPAAREQEVEHDHDGDGVPDHGVQEDDHDDPDDNDDDAHDDHDHEATDANRVELTPDQRQRTDLRLATAGPGTIAVTGSFPGEVVLNPDRMAHIVPRAAGIVREVSVSLGDQVEAGEILAWIESDELAEAKLAFYAKHAEVGCCQVELPRALEIFENTNRLLLLLEHDPSPAQLQKIENLEMGEYRGKLLIAYSNFQAASKTLQRERALFEKNVSSESELIQAEAAFNRAQAAFAAARDTARYQVLIDYTEAAQKRQVAEFEAVAAEQRLRLMGADDSVMADLLALVPKTAGLEPCLCDDPNCKDGEIPSVIDTLGDEHRLGFYALRAPFTGFITEKHLTLGEKIGDEESVMTIADTSSVWVRFNVYQKDLSLADVGQAVEIDLGPAMPHIAGAVTYVSQIIDRETRTARARVELDNPHGTLRPGLYATVRVDVDSVPAPVVIPRNAVQVVDDENVVFVEDGDGFVPTPVHLGRSDRDRVIILSGLAPGQRYVEQGAFELKAHIVTSGIDPHAGHGH
jgi:cobalt-zinc-cadmium efflux system membrane fusion protein